MDHHLLYLLNLITSGGVALILLGIGAAKSSQPNPRRGGGTTWALYLWSCWWISLVLTYLMLLLHGPLTPSGSLALVDVGNACTLAAALAYCKGDAFKLDNLNPLVWLLGIVLIWDLVLPNSSTSPSVMILAMGPSVLLSSISIVALGWAIVVRCGWMAWPMLILTAAYAVVQLPAYLSFYVIDAFSDLAPHFNALAHAFTALMVGKVLLAAVFLGYYFSPDHNKERASELYWPRETAIRPHPALARVAIWFCSVVVALIIAWVGSQHIHIPPKGVDRSNVPADSSGFQDRHRVGPVILHDSTGTRARAQLD